MTAKKINAVLSLIASALLLEHTLFSTAALFMNRITGMPLAAVTPLVISFGLHALLSLWILFFSTDSKTLKPYLKENARTVVQRLSAFAMIVLVFAHILTYSLVDNGGLTGFFGTILKVLLEVIFSGLCLIHLSSSFRNSLITLGLLKTGKGAKRTDLIVRIVLIAVGALLLAATFTFFVRRSA